MLVTLDNFKGIISLSAIGNTGNSRVDVNGKDYINEMIAKYEPEYFSKIFGSTLYDYLLAYEGTDASILSIISNLTEAAACYIYNAILIERKSTYNGESIMSGKSEGNPAQPIEEKTTEVHNRMVQCNRNAIEVFFNSQSTLWTEKECYSFNPFIEFILC